MPTETMATELMSSGDKAEIFDGILQEDQRTGWVLYPKRAFCFVFSSNDLDLGARREGFFPLDVLHLGIERSRRGNVRWSPFWSPGVT